MGLLDETSSILTNPLVDAAVGGVVGDLLTPRRERARGIATGVGLGAGIGESVQSGKRSQAELDLNTQNVKSEIASRNALLAQATRAQQEQDASLPTVQQMLTSQISSPLGKQLFPGMTPASVGKIQDFGTATKMLEDFDKAQTEYIKSNGQLTISTVKGTIGDDGLPHNIQVGTRHDGTEAFRRDLGVDYERPVNVNVNNQPTGVADPFAKDRDKPWAANLPANNDPLLPRYTLSEVTKARSDAQAKYNTEHPAVKPEATDTALKKEVDTEKAVTDTYTKAHGVRPSIFGGAVGNSRDAWDKGLKDALKAKGLGGVKAGATSTTKDGRPVVMGEDGHWHLAE